MCRYALTPIALANVSVARNFSLVSYSTVARIDNQKAEIARQPYVGEFLSAKKIFDNIEEVTSVDDNFRRVLFGTWVSGDPDFDTYRRKYEEISTATSLRPTVNKVDIVNPSNLEAVKEIKSGSLVSLVINSTTVHILVPRQLQAALFDNWEERENVVYLLGAYAKDMGIDADVISPNGTKYLFQPPIPTKKGKSLAEGYEYRPFSKYFFNEFFLRIWKLFAKDVQLSILNCQPCDVLCIKSFIFHDDNHYYFFMSH